MNSGLIHVLVHEWMPTSVVCFVSFLWPFPPPPPPELWVGIHSTYLFVSVVLTGACGLAAIVTSLLVKRLSSSSVTIFTTPSLQY